MKFKLPHFSMYIFIFLGFSRCVEPFEISNSTFEDLLVVEGRITNENTFHTIKLSRTFQVDTSSINPEKNAKVSIVEDSNIIHSFSEQEDGTYISDNRFAAKPNSKYILNIETQSGHKYTSKEESLTKESEIDTVEYRVTQSDTKDENIVIISVNGSSSNTNATYFLYEYEETYKITPRYWSMYTLDTSVYPPLAVAKTNPDDSKICFNTKKSNTILQANTALLSESKISNFAIRSITVTDFILKNRYSILVKQYVQTLDAFNYFETLNKFSSSENVFSQSQVSFIQGNIKAENNPDQKVIGYFEVNSIATKRIFFNNEDVVSDPTNNNTENCASPKVFPKFDDQGNRPLQDAINKDYIFFEFVSGPGTPPTTNNNELPFAMVKRSCGDCRFFGSSVKPDFWID